jgi:hydroxypyruvate isomerase
LGTIATGLVSTSVVAGSLVSLGSPTAASEAKLKGRVKQSVSRWCYGKMKLEDLCQECVKMGIVGVDLVDNPKDWLIIQKYGLVPTMVPGAGNIANGLNDKANHARCKEEFTRNIKAAAENKLPNVITFSGNRRNVSDEEAWENCTSILKDVVKLAEDEGVTICMELLNSKVDHKDYHCDHTAWGVEVVKRVNSPRFKLLYDIYHMQIMEGDIIRTIRDNIQYIAHFHTGGNPGRHEIDDTQELNYPAIMKAIVETGFNGYVAHEFVPARDPMTSLKEAVQICDV